MSTEKTLKNILEELQKNRLTILTLQEIKKEAQGTELVLSKSPGGLHGSIVECIAIFPDGKRMVTAEANQIIVRDIVTQEKLQVLNGHQTTVRAVAILPNNQIISASRENENKRGDYNHYSEMKVWDLTTEKCIEDIKIEKEKCFWNKNVCIGVVSGKEIISSIDSKSYNGQPRYVGHMKCLNVREKNGIIFKTYDPKREILYGNLNIFCMHVLSNNQLILAGSDTIRYSEKVENGLGKVNYKEHYRTIGRINVGGHFSLEEHTDAVTCVAELKNKRLISESLDGTLKI